MGARTQLYQMHHYMQLYHYMVAINFSDIFEFSHVSKTRGHATNCLNRIATTVLATGFLPKELLVCGISCQQV